VSRCILSHRMHISNVSWSQYRLPGFSRKRRPFCRCKISPGQNLLDGIYPRQVWRCTTLEAADEHSLWSFNVGRPPMINIEDYRTPLPVPKQEHDDKPWVEDTGSSGQSSATGAGNRRPAWRSSCLLWTAMLIKIANDIHRNL
jgi:hypothetical protein